MFFRKLFYLIFISFTSIILAQGKVYLVMGSDTGIWEGLDTKRHFHEYKLGLYTDLNRNAYKVMNYEFRNELKDSYGTPLKMTWWMMSGNTFRHSINKNIPYPNSMTFYLMEKYHGENIKIIGDEISLHYHTFTWTDYNQDGEFWWNQALTYDEFKEDFEYTLAQNLIDENVFPVSYRSGWHYMDNQWQKYLENILPFSMHNDYPHKGIDETEPLDNLYDWSLAPAEFVPYHPSEYNYQIPGNLKGYELRSIYMSRVTQDFMDDIFMKALQGTDQVVCIWAHLPESDFLENIQKVHQKAVTSDAAFSNVTFRYTTAVEAMQRWLKTDDRVPPNINITEEEVGDKINLTIQIDEPIFQDYPFVALKDRYLRYQRLPLTKISDGIWKTSNPINKELAAKIGVAVTDKVGNLTTKFINILTDELFIDNSEIEYSEVYGKWSSSENSAWFVDSRIAEIQPNDSAKANWLINIDQAGDYNIFYQIQNLDNPVDSLKFILRSDGSQSLNKIFNHSLKSKEWIYIGTSQLVNSENLLSVTAYNNNNSVKYFASDVIKVSALIKNIELVPEFEAIDYGLVSQTDTAMFNLILNNNGIAKLTIDGISSNNSLIWVDDILPIVINPMERKELSVFFFSNKLGPKEDTLFISSNDPINPIIKIACTASVNPPFIIIDNEDSDFYSETGVWNTSVTQTYGNSSRYSFINQSPRASASFAAELEYSGNYLIEMILPVTENSTDNAKYILSVDNIKVDSVIVNQNTNSGKWVNLFNRFLPRKIPISLKVIDNGNSNAGPVLRTDAVKFQLRDGITNIVENKNEIKPEKFELKQNYPNPFNPSTKINFEIAESDIVNLKIFDVLGNEISVLVNEQIQPGIYTIEFNGSNLPSGVYFCRLKTGDFNKTIKMVLMK